MKRAGAMLAALAALCALLGGCGGFPEPAAYLPWPLGGQGEEADASLLLGPGPDETGLAGAEWGIFESMHRPASHGSGEVGKTVTVYVPVRAEIYEEAGGPPLPGKTVAGGSFVKVQPEGGPLWFRYGDAWLYGEDLLPVEGGRPGETSVAQAAIEERFRLLEQKLPEGSYWNHMGQELPEGVETPFSVTGTPCQHSVHGQVYCNFYNGSMLDLFSEYGSLCQCLGFACLLSDRLFGEDAPLYLLPEGVMPRVGDHLRLLEYEHSVIVREVNELGLRLAEVNPEYEDCRICWQRFFTWEEWDELYGWDVEYVITRYPFYQEEGRRVALPALTPHTHDAGHQVLDGIRAAAP